jgi:hypothetical protein
MISLKIPGSLAALIFIVSCSQPSSPKEELAETKKQINTLAVNIETGISKNGPIGWLTYFEDTPDFFMASNGDLVFKDYKTAHSFISNVLIKTISKIKLNWANIRINAFGENWGSIGADFHEELIDPSGKIIAINGYFTATAHKTSSGWKLRNVQWSIKPGN